MASVVASIDTQHEDMIHDLQYDYYAKKLATCSSDRTIKIFDINHTTAGEIHHNSATLTGHSGPVWQVAWAHPKFGTILASCSYDGLVIIHREMSQNTWAKIYEFAVPDSSVNSISWAPHEYGYLEYYTKIVVLSQINTTFY
jgi:protein transport protein SEC13